MTSSPKWDKIVSDIIEEWCISVKFEDSFWKSTYEKYPKKADARSKIGEIAFIEYAHCKTNSSRERIAFQIPQILIISLQFSSLNDGDNSIRVDKSAIAETKSAENPVRHVYFLQEIPKRKAFRVLGGIPIDRLSNICNKTKTAYFTVYLSDLKVKSFYPECGGIPLHVFLHLCNAPLDEISECLVIENMAEEAFRLVEDRISLLQNVKEVVHSQKMQFGSKEQREHDLKKLLNNPLMRAIPLNTTSESTLNCCQMDDSFWYTCCLCFDVHASFGSWFIDREMELLQLRLDSSCKNENDVLEIVRLNKPDALVLVDRNDLADTGKRLFAKVFPNDPLPTVWFSIPFSVSPRCMKGMKCILENGNCIVSYLHLRDYVFLDLTRDHLKSLVFDNAKIRDFMHRLSNELPHVKGEIETLKKRIDVTLRAQNSGLTIPVELPDIEDCVKFFPLCTSIYANNLKKNGKLRWDQRRAFSGNLLDIGYNKEETAGYLYKINREKNGNTLDEQWEKDVTSLMNRKQKADTSFAKGCAKLTEERTNVAHEDDTAECCPYQFFTKDKLIEALALKGLDERDPRTEIIIKFAKENKNPIGACMKMFEFEHGQYATLSKNGFWSLKSPQGYTLRALRQKKFSTTFDNNNKN